MTARRPCPQPPPSGSLEDYAVHFDAVFHALAQLHALRLYLANLLAPSERAKTLTAPAGAKPLIQAQAAPVQQLQFFRSEVHWDADAIAARTLALLRGDPLVAPTPDDVLVLDDTGDRKDGCVTDHIARQYLGSIGKIDNGIVAVTTLWANAQQVGATQGAHAGVAAMPLDDAAKGLPRHELHDLCKQRLAHVHASPQIA